ncbi:hypothetical protein [Falsiroseomonas sp. E2-1-a20]|uniref:hypothetical protein n=1 Tax=Falsiroseomonas sp. E2-1-a20 TaxID=3239300 RepID=UPI003F3E6A04
MPRDADPRIWWRNLSGGYLDGREPPPGRDAPYPNLATVPPRPVPPDAATRAAITEALAADRQGSRDALIVAPAGPPQAGTGLPGGTRPPAPPRLAAVPRINLDPEPAPGPQAAPRAAPVVVAPAAEAQAPPPLSGPPAAPAPSLLAPPAAAPDLSGPPPAPGADLLAPRRD